MTGALPNGTEISNGIEEQEPNSVFKVENTSGNPQSTSPYCSMTGAVQPGSWKLNAISRRWGGSRAQTRKNEERWSDFNRSSSAGEGGITAEAASPVTGELITTETWQSSNWPGWGSAAWVACPMAPSGTLKSRSQRGHPARGLPHWFRGAPAAMRQRSAPASRGCSTVAACQQGSAL